MRVLKVKNHMKPLLEFQGGGYSSLGTSGSTHDQPYCEYRVFPLLHNLEQKGNSTDFNIKAFDIKVGDVVSGICLYDSKTHTGPIQRFYRDAEKDPNAGPKYVYILDQDSRLVPLNPKTLKKKKTYDELSHPQNIWDGRREITYDNV